MLLPCGYLVDGYPATAGRSCRRLPGGGGPALVVESVGGVDAARRVREGEAVDLVFLASDALAKLAVTRHVLADSCVALVRSQVASGLPRWRDGARISVTPMRCARRFCRQRRWVTRPGRAAPHLRVVRSLGHSRQRAASCGKRQRAFRWRRWCHVATSSLAFSSAVK